MTQSLTALLPRLIHFLTDTSPTLQSHHLLTLLPAATLSLSAHLHKLAVLPLRSRSHLSSSHPDLEDALRSLDAALDRRIARAEREREKLRAQVEGYRKVTSGGKGGGGRYEKVMGEREEVRRAREQVERDLERLGRRGGR